MKFKRSLLFVDYSCFANVLLAKKLSSEDKFKAPSFALPFNHNLSNLTLINGDPAGHRAILRAPPASDRVLANLLVLHGTRRAQVAVPHGRRL